jgi:hypothetical protein
MNLVYSAQNADTMAAVPENKHIKRYTSSLREQRKTRRSRNDGGFWRTRAAICRGAPCHVPAEHSQRLTGVGRAEGEGGYVGAGQCSAGVQAWFEAGLLLLLLLQLLLLGDRAGKYDGGERIHCAP